MFGHRYFGARFFGPRYFGPALASEAEPGEEPPDEEPVANPCDVTYEVDGSCPPNSSTQPGVVGPVGPPGPQGPPGPPGDAGTECDWCCPIFCGIDSPEGSVVASVGAPFEQTNAAITTHPLWVKREGAETNTGWRGWAGLRGEAAGSFAIGDNSVASGVDSLAFGENAEATGARAEAIGKSSIAAGDDAKAFGAGAQALATETIAIGKDVIVAAGALRSIAAGVGSSVPTDAVDAIVIGGSTGTSSRQRIIGKGNLLPAIDDFDEVLIFGDENDGTDAAFRGSSYIDTIIIGRRNLFGVHESGESNIVIGNDNEVTGAALVAIGNSIRGWEGIVAGTAVPNPTYGVMIGEDSEAQADCFIAVGYQAKAYGIGATAAGPHARAGDDADSLHTTALGRFASARGDQGIALGSSASVGAAFSNGIALGHAAAVSASNQLMIGHSTAANRILGIRFNSGAADAMTIDQFGNVTFNGTIASPSSTHVIGTTLDSTHGTVRVDTTSGNLTFDLPTAASVVNRVYTIIKVSVDANTVTVDANGGELINGATTVVLATQFEKVVIQSNGTSWDIIG